MFDKNYFPTPDAVSHIMLSGLDMKGKKTFLDPSAGEGHLLDAIAERRRVSYGYDRSDGKDELYAIELDPGRQAILRDKGYKVIDADFLRYNGLRYFDYLIANPPFEDGASHLLKMWDVANGATIRCLLNSETLKNPYTEERKRLVSIIKRYGWSKDLGQAFRNAERSTDVFVSLVHLNDTRKGEAFRLDFEPKKANGRLKFEDIDEKGLAPANVFLSYEQQYNAGIAAFKELLLARQKVDHFLDSVLSERKSGRNLVAEALMTNQDSDVAYKAFFKEATKESWSNLFNKTKLARVVTESVQKDLLEQQAQQGLMAFTAENMEALFNQLFLSREKIMTDCVLEAFQLMTKWYKDNRVYEAGFKTNSSYKVGKRFILSNMGSSWSEGLDYGSKRTVSDIEKALCFMTGRHNEGILSLATIYANDSYYGEKKVSEFFFTRLYKKGTLHFEWLDEDLMNRFNMAAAEAMWGNQVPEKTKSGAYS